MTTPTRPPRESERLPESLAKSLLARASELDANSAAVSELRAAAVEAGISNAAFEAALAEYRQGGQVAATLKPAETPAPGRAPRKFMVISAAALFVGLLGWAAMRGVPSQVQVVDPFSTRIALGCISPEAAAELARTVLDLRNSTITASPGALSISAPTQEQLDRVRSLVAQREQAVCPLPPPPPATTPAPPGR